MKAHRRLLAVALPVVLTAPLPADSTINFTNKFAYSANAGWLNFRHNQPSSPNGIVFGEYVVSGFAYGANFGWVNLGDGSPVNGIQYQNNSASDYGVNHDGLGNLSGYAYGANIGWINFGWTNTSNLNRPRVDLLTGSFTGYAYSANIGWINLGAGYLVTDTMANPDNDADADGIPDPWELTHFSNLTTATMTSDADGDGATDKSEYISATDPKDAKVFFKIVSSTYGGGFTQATVVFTTAASRVYRLETSDNLVAWTNSALGTFAPDAGSTTTKLIVWPGASKKFIRAVALKPLP